ncbi:hypothetical protein A3Q56_06323 [Intoshia linei]|uniref:Uncharacterized protein n=1 Tax=Intoshia linei TaxID=1819745 RepID=A0A177AVB1_9BILA|nr:hypothetical protein A3Q56_06323 [Intoshia linei]
MTKQYPINLHTIIKIIFQIGFLLVNLNNHLFHDSQLLVITSDPPADITDRYIDPLSSNEMVKGRLLSDSSNSSDIQNEDKSPLPTRWRRFLKKYDYFYTETDYADSP